MSTFVPLHNHSHYSLLRALPKIADLVEKAKEAGCTALALTDLDTLYGTIDFYKECTDAGIKPIIGVDFAVEGGGRLVLLAENDLGYKNLIALVSNIRGEDAFGVPVTEELLRKHTEGLLALVPRKFVQQTARYKEVFGEKNWYPDVPLWEVFYLDGSDRTAWETLRAIDKSGPAPENGLDEEEDNFAFPSHEQFVARFDADAAAKTQEIADRCNVTLTIGKFIFPEFPLPPGKTADELLRELCMEGIKNRKVEGREDVLVRLNYELDIIKFKGYAAYFLVVEDLIRFAREKDIYTNIRGSVAGSITTYLLRITKVDPLAYQIPFERFLNPDRPSAPDIDMDFADNRRDEVIEYTRQKYGEDHVAQIGTFGTMLARGVVRDVARALGYPYGLGDRIAKEIPMGSQGMPMTLDRAMIDNPELGKMYKSDSEVREIIDLGKKIEGCARHISVHAAGVVISPKALVEYTPMQRDPKGGKLITQYDMYSVGEDGVGLTKFDFLGIRNLTILKDAVSIVEITRKEKVDIEEIPLDDPKTFAMLARGDTEATFQLNGSGMTRFLKELRPTTIHDINAMVALYRPGPMQFIPTYIERKHNASLISYMDPAMEPILRQTYGVLVYQDDLLIMAHELAGYAWGEVDKFRKAVGKKNPEEMAKQKEKFIEGCVEHSKWPRAKAERIWAWIEPFAAYGFNKAHSASYGRVAYQTAYMKANYPVEYMTAVLTAEAGNIDTVAIMVRECKRMGINVLPPDVNESFADFTAFPNLTEDPTNPSLGGIRFGLRSIKNFGESVAASIITERKAHGPYVSVSDFLRRITDKNLNKKSLESLIECGALDRFGERGDMLASLDRLLEYHREHALANQNQDSLFSLMSGGAPEDLTLPKAAPVPMETKLAWEKELLGLFVSGHPLDKHKEKLAQRSITISQIAERMKPGMECVIMGMIENARIILTKGGDQMAFLKITDDSGSLEAVIFPKLFAKEKQLFAPDQVIAIKGRLNDRNGELSVIAEAAKML